jgi:hypothetical protein
MEHWRWRDASEVAECVRNGARGGQNMSEHVRTVRYSLEVAGVDRADKGVRDGQRGQKHQRQTKQM